MPRNAKRKMPVANVPTGLPYGKHQQLVQQAAALPATPASGGLQPPVDPHTAAVQGMSRLPQLTPLNAPTQRPGEPVTAGLPNSPGPGPEAIATQFQPSNSLADMLEMMAQSSGDPTYAAWARTARTPNA